MHYLEYANWWQELSRLTIEGLYPTVGWNTEQVFGARRSVIEQSSVPQARLGASLPTVH